MGFEIFGGVAHFRVRPLPAPPGGKFSGDFLVPRNVSKRRWNCVEIYFQFRVIAIGIFRFGLTLGPLPKNSVVRFKKFSTERQYVAPTITWWYGLFCPPTLSTGKMSRNFEKKSFFALCKMRGAMFR